MSSLGLNIGLKSLLTAQAHLETIGHNVSNATTPGYSRQSLQTSASSPLRLRGLLQGTGVQGDVIGSRETNEAGGTVRQQRGRQ